MTRPVADMAVSRGRHDERAAFVPTSDGFGVIAGVHGDPSRATLAWVADHVDRWPTHVQLLTVLDVEEDRDAELSQSLAALQDAEGALRILNPEAHVHIKVAEGDPVDELLRTDSELYVIGAGRTAGEAVAGGSVTTRLPARSRRPVVTVPSDWRPRPGADVVVAVAPDLATDDAVEFAARVARRHGRTLRLVHVAGEDDGPDERLLEEAELVARAAGADAVRNESRRGEVAVELARAAANADLLVIGRPDRSGVARLLLGSVGRDVLRMLPCPVAIVPVRHGVVGRR